MELTLPAPIESRLTKDKAALNLAIGLYISEEVTLGQAAEVACMGQIEFQGELAKRHISLNYGIADFEEDLANLRALGLR